MGLSVDYGAYVIREHSAETAVIPKSPAEKAGIFRTRYRPRMEWTKISPESALQDFWKIARLERRFRLKFSALGKNGV